MKFLRVKKSSCFCFHCGAQITAGEDCCCIINSQKKVLLFHLGCYLPWITGNFNTKYQKWKIEQTEDKVKHGQKKKRGRPFRFSHPHIANKVRSSLHYYKRTGNLDKVQELEQELSKLVIRR